MIGGTTNTARNIISGNLAGVVVADAGTSNNLITRNYIGTIAAGNGALGNLIVGIVVERERQHDQHERDFGKQLGSAYSRRCL